MSSDGKSDGPTPPIPLHLRYAFTAVRDEHQDSQDALRDAVCAYLAELRRNGVGDAEQRVRAQFIALEALSPDEAPPAWRTDLVNAILRSCD